MLVRQAFVQRAIDGQAANAAIEYSNRKVVIQAGGFCLKMNMVEAQGIEP